MKTGSTYVKNSSILHISGTNFGDNWFIGEDYFVEYVEAESND